MVDSIKVPDNLRDAFDSLMADDAACRAKLAHFSQVVHAEQKAVTVKAQELWTETRTVMQLGFGEWTYADGFVHRVMPPTTEATGT